MNLTLSTDYEINEIEPCFVMEKNTNKIYIPKLMPLIQNGSVSKSSVSINPNLINANECTPTISKRISSQNFITALGSPQFSMKPWQYGEVYERVFSKGQRALCVVVNKNPRFIVLTNNPC